MKKEIKNYLFAIVGGALVGIGAGWILLPIKLTTGGFSGIATLVYYLFHIPAGLVTLCLNIPLFIVSWKMLGFSYSFRSLMSMISLSFALEFAQTWTPLTDDLILASVFGGVIVGIGLAISVRGKSTTGGSDLIAKLIQTKKPYLNLSRVLLVIDGIIIAVASVTFDSIEVALYSGIAVFVMTKTMDLFLEGGNYVKAMFIITNKADEISEYILNEVGRGATKVLGKGAYSNEEKEVLICVANKREVPGIKNKIKALDDKCFMIVTTVTEAIGSGFMS